jgi:DNA-binding XRE family transcriptional regulator
MCLMLARGCVLALQLEDVFSAKAKENQVLSGENYGKGSQISANPIIETVDTRQELAKIANVSHDTIAKVKRIEAVAK